MMHVGVEESGKCSSGMVCGHYYACEKCYGLFNGLECMGLCCDASRYENPEFTKDFKKLT